MKKIILSFVFAMMSLVSFGQNIAPYIEVNGFLFVAEIDKKRLYIVIIWRDFANKTQKSAFFY